MLFLCKFHLEKILFFMLVLSFFCGQAMFVLSPVLQCCRIISPICLLYIFYQKRIVIDSKYHSIMIFAVFYYLYTLAITVVYGRLELNSLINFTTLLVFIFIFIFFLNKDELLYRDYFYHCSIIFILLSILVTILEMTMGIHFHHSVITSIVDDSPWMKFIPTGFYVNQNDFSVSVSFATLFCFLYKRNNYWNLLFFFFSFFLSIVTGARLCSLVLAFFLICIYPKKVIVSLLFLFLLLYFFLSFVNIDLLKDFFLAEDSDSTRMGLYIEGFKSLEKSYFLGLGISGAEFYLKDYANHSVTDGITAPHSYLMEILINSGAFFCVFFLYLWWRYTWKLLFVNKVVALEMFLYPLLLFAPSGSTFLWFHYMYFIVYMTYMKK